MANIENKRVFKKNKIPGDESTKMMVYRAGSLYSAKSDAQKIFKLLSKLIFDENEF